MARYGRDHHDGWLERAGETVRGWMGGHDHERYDRDYGMRGTHRERPMGYSEHGLGGYHDVGWGSDDHRGGGWQGSGYRRGWGDADRQTYVPGDHARGRPMGGMQGGGHDRAWGGGMDRGMQGGGRSPSGYSGEWQGQGRGMGRDWDDRDQEMGGYRRGGSYGGSYGNQGPRMADHYGDQGMQRMSGGGYGPYGAGSIRFGGGSAGGVRPGERFTGYGHGSANRYSPLW